MPEKFDDYNRLVPLRREMEPADAQLMRSLLTANGIEVFLNGENMGSLNYVVRTDIMIRAIDKVRAESVLKKVSAIPRRQLPSHFDGDGEERACAQCGSTQIHPYVGEVPTIIPGIRLSAGAGEGWYHCLQCDSHYRDQPTRFSGMPIALMWGGFLGASGFALYWIIDWLKWL